MRYLAAMLMTGAVTWMPAALGSECFSIQDADQRNACLASAKKDKSYCFKIQDAELREGCLAPLKGETYGCFKIQDPDSRAACLGETQITLGQILGMKVGDVIPFNIEEVITAEIDHVPVMECRYGLQHGQYALKVERFIAPDRIEKR